MSNGTAVDYDALAKQYGASSSAIDYDALAKQHGATSSAAILDAPPELPISRPSLEMKESLAPKLVRGATALLPSAGAVAGGAVASPGIVTAAGGAGLGAMAGKQSELLINRALFGKDEPSTISKEGLKQTAISGVEGAFTGGATSFAAKNAISPFVKSGEATLSKVSPDWQKINQLIGATTKSVRFPEGVQDLAEVTTNPARGLSSKGLTSDVLSKMSPFERLQAVVPIKNAAGAAVDKAASDATAKGITFDLEKSAFKTLGNIADDELQTKAVDTLHKLVEQVGISDVRTATPQQAIQLRRILGEKARFLPQGDLSSLGTVKAQLYRAVTGDLHKEIPEMIPVDRDFTDLKTATDLIKNGVAKSLTKVPPSTIKMIMSHPVYGPLARGTLGLLPAGVAGYLFKDYIKGLAAQ